MKKLKHPKVLFIGILFLVTVFRTDAQNISISECFNRIEALKREKLIKIESDSIQSIFLYQDSIPIQYLKPMKKKLSFQHRYKYVSLAWDTSHSFVIYKKLLKSVYYGIFKTSPFFIRRFYYNTTDSLRIDFSLNIEENIGRKIEKRVITNLARVSIYNWKDELLAIFTFIDIFYQEPNSQPYKQAILFERINSGKKEKLIKQINDDFYVNTSINYFLDIFKNPDY